MVGGSIEEACQQYIIALNYVLDLYFNQIYMDFNTFSYPFKRAPFLCDLADYMQKIEERGFATLQRKTFLKDFEVTPAQHAVFTIPLNLQNVD